MAFSDLKLINVSPVVIPYRVPKSLLITQGIFTSGRYRDLIPIFLFILVIGLLTVGCSDAASQSVLQKIIQPSCECPTIPPTPSRSTSTPITVSSPTPSLSPTPAICLEKHGHIEHNQLDAKMLPYPLVVRIYLPPCYDPESSFRYPVLILLHGQSFNDDQWDRLGADETADKLISAGEAPPFLIVMPREDYYLQDPLESGFGEAVVKALIPWIDQNFTTCAQRSCRAIGGISRGSGWAMKMGLIHWESFSAIGAHSYAPFTGDFINIPFWLKEIPAEQMPRIYIDAGILDFVLKPANKIEQRLTEYLIPHEWHVLDGTHNEESWRMNIEDYLRWYTKPWKNIY